MPRTGDETKTKFVHTVVMDTLTKGTDMITVRFDKVTMHDTIFEPRTLGTFHGEGETVDDAWWQVAENLAERERCDPRDFSYDEATAA